MSHELRTPMHAMLSFARLGSKRVRDGDPEKIASYFEKIEQSAQRLLRLLNDLLDLSKMEAGRMTYEMAPHDIGGVVRGILDQLEPMASQRGIRLEVDLPATPVSAVVDRARIEQVLQNLVANAMKFSPAGEVVSVTVVRAGGPESSIAGSSCRIRVSDHGVGIPPDELEVIFDKFIQSSKTRSGAGGTGLGLAICREIIAAHGGTIVASNGSDGGSVLTIDLPGSPVASTLDGGR